MMHLFEDEVLAIDVVQAIRIGDVPLLRRLLTEHKGLGAARIVSRSSGKDAGSSRSLLHVVTDWPGHYPNATLIVASLLEYGADVNDRFSGPHSETPLHWAASTDDIEVLDALLDAGANIEASGAVIAGGTPLDDAIAFGQWRSAERLVERGAQMALWHAAALGKIDAVKQHFSGTKLVGHYPWLAGATTSSDEVTVSFWCACHGGQRHTAAYLLSHGANLNWISVWDGLTPLDVAQRSDATILVQWLRNLGAKLASELKTI